MADFGKLNFAVAFVPQTAFPLDGRTYFESLETARAAAATAVPVGSSDGVYHYGTVSHVNQTTGNTTITVSCGAGTNYTAPSNKTVDVIASFMPPMGNALDTYTWEQIAQIWVGLSVVAIILDDYFRYWFFGEEKPHYMLV